MYKVVIDLAWGLRFDRWSSEKFFTRRPTTPEIKEAFKDEVTLTDEDFEDYMSGRVVVDKIKVEEKEYCPECKGLINDDGSTMWGMCEYGEFQCELCGSCECDQSC